MARLFAFTLLLFGIAALAVSGSPADNSMTGCAKWCANHFAYGSNCTSLAAKGEGPCYVCGPQKTVSSEKLCQGECTDTSTDNDNCGSCRNKCNTGFQCTAGICTCPPPLDDCITACTDIRFDDQNCGRCGNVCPPTVSECVNGNCFCKTGFIPPCNGICPGKLSPINAYCLCGSVCPSGYKCSKGACIEK